MAQTLPDEALWGPLMTAEEWADLPDEVPGELVQGRLVEEEMPDYGHEVIVAWLGHMLGNWADVASAIVGGSGAKFVVDRSHGRKPDITVFLAGRRPPRRGAVRLPPDIAVEVISAGPRDVKRGRVEKPAEYARFGVRWYWLVDPERKTFEIHERASENSYSLAVQQSGGVVKPVPGCSGLELDLDAMWAKADALGEPE